MPYSRHLPRPRVRQLLNREALNIETHRLIRRLGRSAGLDVVRADFNSPIVAPGELAPEEWDRPLRLHGLDLDLDRQVGMLGRRLRPFIDELMVPITAPADRLAIHLDNPWYGPMDAHTLYAMLRSINPRRVLELGSGFSSLFIDLALDANLGHGATERASHEIVDPFPSPVLSRLGSRVSVSVQSAASVAIERFASLKSGDVLVVDTSHVVRPGGEVVRIVLEILPELASGVVVHFHDIFLPYAYPRIFYDRYNVHWQEQYLVAAFLAFNPHFIVELSNHALWRLRRDAVAALFPGLREGMQPGAFWIVRT